VILNPSIDVFDSPTIVSFAVPKPQDVVDIKEQLETYRLLNKVSVRAIKSHFPALTLCIADSSIARAAV
jgi:hypothetical protein